jgi:hypothetical protein
MVGLLRVRRGVLAGLLTTIGLVVALGPASAAPPVSQVAPTVLINSSFTGTATPVDITGASSRITGTVAPRWGDNSAWSNIDVTYERITAGRTDTAAQRATITRSNAGQMELYHPLTLRAGRLYEATAWLRGTPGARLSVSMGEVDAPYRSFGESVVDLTGEWQLVRLAGHQTMNATGKFVVIANKPLTVDIDDVRVTSVPAPVGLAPAAGIMTQPMPADVFGMHLGSILDQRPTNPGLDGAYGAVVTADASITGVVADGWGDNSDWGDVDVRYSQETATARSGGSAQRIDVDAIREGRMQFAQELALPVSSTHRFSIWLKGTGTAKLDVTDPADGYRSLAVLDVPLTSQWRQATFDLVTTATSSRQLFMVAADQPGTTIWVDDLSVVDANGQPVGFAFPDRSGGVLRLWDTRTTWARLEPQRGQWNWDILDNWVAEAQRRGMRVVLTLGQTPRWASSRPDEVTFYGAGAPAAPANLDDWRRYVRTVAERYRGRIAVYEVWNEPNDTTFGSMTMTELVDLTRTAGEVLDQVDPAATLMSPSAYSAGWLDRFLQRGGGDLVDVIGHHIYVDQPEDAARYLADLRRIMAVNGVTKPLWLTEGAAGNETLTEAQAVAALARWHLVQLAGGAERAWWYTFGTGGDIWGPTTLPRSFTPNAAYRAFEELQDWMVGRRITAATIGADGAWRIDMTDADAASSSRFRWRIVWHPTRSVAMSPADATYPSVRGLDGSLVTNIGVRISTTPVLLGDETGGGGDDGAGGGGGDA